MNELIMVGVAVVTLFLTILVNIATIAYFAGTLKANQTAQKEMVGLIKNELERQIKDTKEETINHFDQLEKKQDKHNSMIERQFKTESDVEVLYEKIEVANHRIEDLEELKK